tara:strand:+ start:169 stop:348 length:180 start_codon:yes stop_codon:yes gene_type:complete
MKTYLTGFGLLMIICAAGFIDDCDGACLGKENWTAFWMCLGLGFTSLLGSLGLELKEDN